MSKVDELREMFIADHGGGEVFEARLRQLLQAARQEGEAKGREASAPLIRTAIVWLNEFAEAGNGMARKDAKKMRAFLRAAPTPSESQAAPQPPSEFYNFGMSKHQPPAGEVAKSPYKHEHASDYACPACEDAGPMEPATCVTCGGSGGSHGFCLCLPDDPGCHPCPTCAKGGE